MTPIKQAVILAGGMGTRLRPLTLDRPKPLVVVNGRPFAEYLVDLLKNNGIEEIVFLTGYLGKKIKEHFGDGSRFGLRVKYSHGEITDETGTRLRNAGSILNKKFLLMYCDNYWPLNLEKLCEFHESRGVSATVTVYSNKYGVTKNNALVDANGLVKKYDRTRTEEELNGVDLGFFVMEKSITDAMPDHNFSLEKELLPELIARNQLAGFMTDHRHYGIGKLERLPLTEEFLKPKKIIFLDRDGVINKKAEKLRYVVKWDDFEFLPGAREGIALLTQSGYKIFVVTNQAGITRGAMTEDDLSEIHENMKKEIRNSGGAITQIYHCPHGWDDGCGCRKPKPGMLFQAAHSYHLDLTKATLIGDEEKDMEASRAAGCRAILASADRNIFNIAQSLML